MIDLWLVLDSRSSAPEFWELASFKKKKEEGKRIMMRDLEDALKWLHQANYLMSQGKVDDARPLIESLEGRDDFPPDEQLTYQLLKSQLLITTGDFKASIQLAEQVREKSQLQNKPLQAVDAVS
jgi:tetratricopeptide (TPR) repeat protein